MMCAWDALLHLLPMGLRGQVDRQGKDRAQELRLRLGEPPELVTEGESVFLEGNSRREDLEYVIAAASRFSPWAAQTLAQGYLTADGGHRIGVCGQALCREGHITGIGRVTSLCIRVARDIPDIGKTADQGGSMLILGAPGWGKTTLLRDVIRLRSRREPVCVVDRRGELFPTGFLRGPRTDVLEGCPNGEGVMMALRTMSPRCIAVDEITQEADCQALVQAANCGVDLLATAHASSAEEYGMRELYRPLRNIFDRLAVLKPDKTYTLERMETV